MNERIKKLVDEATSYKEGLIEGKHDIEVFDKEKFAELIVRECMDLALSEQKRYAAFTHRNLSECAVTVSNFRLLMKDHFGVEE